MHTELPRYHVKCDCEDFPPQIYKVKNRTYIRKHDCPCYKKRRSTTKKIRKNKMFAAVEDLDNRPIENIDNNCTFIAGFK